MQAVTLWAANTTVKVGGKSIVAMYGPMAGGLIVNPYQALDQGLAIVEVLYVSLDGPAALEANDTTFAIQPGGFFPVPADQTNNVWVNSASSGHKFSAFVIQADSKFTPTTSTFPPDSPTTLLKVIPSYLYVEYNDDDALQAFVQAQNEIAQGNTDWFVNIGLPVYTNQYIVGALLDLIALGIYGMERPALPSGRNQNLGPYNTFVFNQLAFNEQLIIGNQDYYVTTDDIFKRILTWHLYKGDGKVFTIQWLKRRIMRFLFGVNGVDPPVDNTYPISVTFGVGNQVNINIGLGKRTIVGGALYNEMAFNTAAFNELITTFEQGPAIPAAVILKAAIDSGALELPFQFTYEVNIA